MHKPVEAAQLQELKSLWSALFRVPVPVDEQFALWLFQYGPEITKVALGQLATKYQKLHGEMDQDFMIRFASSVMRRLCQEAEAERQKALQGECAELDARFAEEMEAA